MDKRELLKKTDFGHRIAEEEAKHLIEYFVQTDQWRSVFSGEVDIVYGAKGAGKSAIYSLLLGHEQQLNNRGIQVIAAENPRGAAVFAELVVDPPAGEEEFRGLWKLYFLCLIGRQLRRLGNLPYPAPQVIRKLEESQLLPHDASLSGLLRSVIDYVRRAVRAESVGLGVEINPVTGLPSGMIGKITLREPATHLHRVGFSSIDELLKQADTALNSMGLKAWVLLDRLDVAFAESPELESNALRALFRVYLDFGSFSAISLKIFLRSDIWARIKYDGKQAFREASHISRHTTINWNAQSIVNLIVRRLLHNEAIRTWYNLEAASVLSDISKQSQLLARVFPTQFNIDWMLYQLVDGTRRIAPREVIHFLHCARDIQLKKLELGGREPDGQALFDFNSLRQSLPEVSQVRFEQTICAEYPHCRPYLMRLKGEYIQQSLANLRVIWQEPVHNVASVAENLVEIGFFERRGERQEPLFWVPPIYRSALSMKDKEPRKL